MRIEKHVFPKIGKTPISQLEIPDILNVVKPVEQEGHVATAKFVLQSISQIFRYAVLSGRAKHNIAADLQGVLRPVQTTHHATITNEARWANFCGVLTNTKDIIRRLVS